MFIAGSYMLYSSQSPNYSNVIVPCSSPAIATTAATAAAIPTPQPPPHFSVSAFTATTTPIMSSTQQNHRSLEPADLSHLKKVTGFSVSDILERNRSTVASVEVVDEDLVNEKSKTAACVVVTPSGPSLKRRRLRGDGGSVSSMSSISPSSSSSSSSSSTSSSDPSSPLSLPPSPTFSPHSSVSMDMPQDLSSALLPSKLSSPIRQTYSSQPSHFSHQLKFGVDRILSNDLTSIGRKEIPSSCTMCVSPFSHGHHLSSSLVPHPQPLPLPPPTTTLRCRTSGVPCECMHPLCDGTGLIPALYTYSSLPFPTCAIYPPPPPPPPLPHHITSERDTSRVGGPPHFHHQNSYNHHNHQHNHHNQSNGQNPVSGKRKRSWSRAVFSNLQRKGLEKRFQIQKYITKPDRRQLAATLGLTDAQVKVWFQNRRMKWRHSKEAKEEFAKQAVTKATEQQQNNNNEIRKITTESKDNIKTKSID